jgi:hypothetical protein
MKMAKHPMKWRFIADNSEKNAEIAVKLDINCSNVKIEEIKMAVATVKCEWKYLLHLLLQA